MISRDRSLTMALRDAPREASGPHLFDLNLEAEDVGGLAVDDIGWGKGGDRGDRTDSRLEVVLGWEIYSDWIFGFLSYATDVGIHLETSERSVYERGG